MRVKLRDVPVGARCGWGCGCEGVRNGLSGTFTVTCRMHHSIIGMSFFVDSADLVTLLDAPTLLTDEQRRSFLRPGARWRYRDDVPNPDWRGKVVALVSSERSLHGWTNWHINESPTAVAESSLTGSADPVIPDGHGGYRLATAADCEPEKPTWQPLRWTCVQAHGEWRWVGMDANGETRETRDVLVAAEMVGAVYSRRVGDPPQLMAVRSADGVTRWGGPGFVDSLEANAEREGNFVTEPGFVEAEPRLTACARYDGALFFGDDDKQAAPATPARDCCDGECREPYTAHGVTLHGHARGADTGVVDDTPTTTHVLGGVALELLMARPTREAAVVVDDADKLGRRDTHRWNYGHLDSRLSLNPTRRKRVRAERWGSVTARRGGR